MKSFKELRQERGLTQSAVAEAVELSTVYIGEIESKKKQGTLTTARRLAKFFGITVDEMIDIILGNKLAYS